MLEDKPVVMVVGEVLATLTHQHGPNSVSAGTNTFTLYMRFNGFIGTLTTMVVIFERLGDCTMSTICKQHSTNAQRVMALM